MKILPLIVLLVMWAVCGKCQDQRELEEACEEQLCLTNVKPTRPSLHKNFMVAPDKKESSSVKCVDSKYRTINGTCNNMKHPNWGVVQSKFVRMLSAKYEDGIHKPRSSKSNKPLPLARLVSTTIYPDVAIPDPKWTLATMSWGQFISHDMSLAMSANQITGENPTCCGNDSKPLSPACMPMFIPENDYFYSQFNQTCLNFVRTATDLDTKENSGNKPAEQLVGVTPWMDASHIYGSADSVASSLREFNGGRLKVDVRKNKHLPPDDPNKNSTCFLDKPNEVCYLFGDNRGVQNPPITVLQILLLREHNRIADELSKINSHWKDEILYQESKRILTAEYQYINYYEWMPIVFGKKHMLKNKLIHETKDYVNDYNEDVDPSIINEHATAAYRFFHSAIQGSLELFTKTGLVSTVKRLSDYYQKPSVLEEGDNLEQLTRGIATQGQQRLDEYHTAEQTNLLFKNRQPFGSDLKATDVQRGRDHGLPSYNDFRELCGFKRAKNFTDFQDLIHIEKIDKLSHVYDNTDDVDFMAGGSMESNAPGALVGPTFLCVLLEQFYRTRVADRYFFELGQLKHSFTIEQLNEIRKSSMARIICDNSDDVHKVQPKAFEKISETNKVESCDNHNLIPTINLKMWKEQH